MFKVCSAITIGRSRERQRHKWWKKLSRKRTNLKNNDIEKYEYKYFIYFVYFLSNSSNSIALLLLFYVIIPFSKILYFLI